ncbi:hypothetical protein QN277_016161 [Acacia crassicarpa]|uniref:CCHC-type domain-containing protein n=1 Tax=Acacia crassicarpa TaxID=499986 RepID=A0AAE1MW21_9FABA|nr:hypothetical protein QN277_016161 [Acacia crassicarpa]
MEVAQISSPLVWKEAIADRILVGKVLSSKLYTRAAIELILQKAWNLPSGFSVTEITGSALLFKFSDVDEYYRILRGRPWTVNGCLLNLLERSKFNSCDEMDFGRCPVWVQIHNVPMEAMCLKNVVTIAGYVGEVVMAEDPYCNGRITRSFLRARVVLDLRASLAYGFWLPKPDGRQVWISIRYEKLQNLCYNCGKIGHDNRTCRVEKLMSVANPNSPRYGDWLTTTSCRSWDEAVEVVCQDWGEAAYARRKKEEAILRRKSAHKQCEDSDQSHAEVDLFCIRVNKEPLEVSEATVLKDKGERNWKWDDNEDEVVGKVERRRQGQMQPEEVPEVCVVSGVQLDVNATKGEAFQSVKMTSDSPIKDRNPKQLADPSGFDNKENSLAMVLYNGQIISDVICGISGLGLKRRADEELILTEQKRRKLDQLKQSPKLAISVYADSLRKTKARARRIGKKRGRGSKMQEADSIISQDADTGSLEEPFSEAQGFIFKAGRGRAVKNISEGAGGWPITATEQP